MADSRGHISGPADVVKSGALVAAYNVQGTAEAATVNGVVFDSFLVNETGGTTGDCTITPNYHVPPIKVGAMAGLRHLIQTLRRSIVRCWVADTPCIRIRLLLLTTAGSPSPSVLSRWVMNTPCSSGSMNRASLG